MKRRLLLIATLVLSAGLSQAAFADAFTLTLSNANQTALPGAVLYYSGTITNATGSNLYLNGIELNQISGLPAFGSVDDPMCPVSAPCTNEASFLINAPTSLTASGPSSSFTGVLFSVNVPLSSAIATFVGTIDITGGPGPSDNYQDSSIVGFSTTVTPEPSSWLLMATGLFGLIVAYRVRHHGVSSLIGL